MGGRGTNVAPRVQQHHHQQQQQHQPAKKRRSHPGAKGKRGGRNTKNLTIYQVIKPNYFADHRPAYADPLSFSRPTRLDIKELKRLAFSSRELLNAWHERFKNGSVETFRNGFIIPDKHRHERQAVFRLKVEDQERLVCNRSRHFWYCLKANNEYDQRQLKKALDRIHDADNNEGAILPTSNYSEQRFVDAVEQNPAWKNAFLRLHHMMKWLKSLIYLHMFSPQFDFRFCELRYEYEPIDSWNPIPVEDGINKHQSSLYQTEFLFQKLTDFILIADQIQALTRALSIEVHNWHKSRYLPPPSPGSELKPNFEQLLHRSSVEMHLAPPGTKLGLMAFDTSREHSANGTSVLRLLVITDESNHRAVIQTCLLDPESQQLKRLIARTEIPRELMQGDPGYINRRQKLEEKYASMIVCDKYIILYEELDIDYEKVKNGKSTPCRIPGPSVTIWDREGRLKEQKTIPFKSDIPCYLKRLPGRRFALVAKMVSDGEAKSLIYNLDNNSEPVMYNGEIEDTNSNYFVLRLADHAQFYAFNNKTDKDAEYLFSIRSFQDEKIRLCSGGQDRFATSRIQLSYHIQVFQFPPRKTMRLNQRPGSPRQTARLGQYGELYDAVEQVSPTADALLTFTRNFKRGGAHENQPLTHDGALIRSVRGDDARLRVLASISGNWHTEWSNERMGLIPDPGDNFALCPNGLLIHDRQHDLICFQPLQRAKINEGRLLLSLPHQTDAASSCFHMPIGGRNWGRLTGHEMFFFSQCVITGALTQHRLCFGLKHQTGFPLIVPKPSKKAQLNRTVSAPASSPTPPPPPSEERPELARRVSFRADLVEEFASLTVNEENGDADYVAG